MTAPTLSASVKEVSDKIDQYNQLQQENRLVPRFKKRGFSALLEWRETTEESLEMSRLRQEMRETIATWKDYSLEERTLFFRENKDRHAFPVHFMDSLKADLQDIFEEGTAAFRVFEDMREFSQQLLDIGDSAITIEAQIKEVESNVLRLRILFSHAGTALGDNEKEMRELKDIAQQKIREAKQINPPANADEKHTLVLLLEEAHDAATQMLAIIDDLKEGQAA